LGVLLDKCKRGLRKFFGSFETLPFIDKVYGENLRLQKVTFWLSPRQCFASKFSEEKLRFSALARARG